MSTNYIVIFLENLASGLYDTRDITRLQTDDAYAGCFIRHVMNDVSAAVSLTHTSLKWRKEMEINGREMEINSREMEINGRRWK